MPVKVFDPKSNVERIVTEKAYNILKKRYQFLSYVDESGAETEGVPIQTKVQKKSVEAAPPAAAKITVQPVIKTPEGIAAKKAELEALNQAAIQKAEEQAEQKERKKPGPKPKINAQV
jgi:hypothetical protein